MIGLGDICIKMVFAKSNFISRSGKTLLGYFLSDVTLSKLSYLPLLLTWLCRLSIDNLPYTITRCQTLGSSRDFSITRKPRFQCVPVFTKNSKVMLWKETVNLMDGENANWAEFFFHNIIHFWSSSSTILWKYHFCLITRLPLKIVENPFIVTCQSIVNMEEEFFTW